MTAAAVRTPAPALPCAASPEPVGLPELVERAALQTRVDRKYVLPLAAADDVLAGLARTTAVRVLDTGGQPARPCVQGTRAPGGDPGRLPPAGSTAPP
ncbi:hypothetical protein [Geodermatophilus maliterrae]|uniref:Uncharacterized protein n=1 Tax=Geodermatophilus maliterrae TaxID=3162531 RepID=A0ABV3XIM2_9ACTN